MFKARYTHFVGVTTESPVLAWYTNLRPPPKIPPQKTTTTTTTTTTPTKTHTHNNNKQTKNKQQKTQQTNNNKKPPPPPPQQQQQPPTKSTVPAKYIRQKVLHKYDTLILRPARLHHGKKRGRLEASSKHTSFKVGHEHVTSLHQGYEAKGLVLE